MTTRTRYPWRKFVELIKARWASMIEYRLEEAGIRSDVGNTHSFVDPSLRVKSKADRANDPATPAVPETPKA